MGLIRSIDELDPSFRANVEAFLAELDAREMKYFIIETKRLLEVQAAYYAQGRQPLDEVNNLRKDAGLWLIKEEQNQKPITWTMKSKHLDGIAIDLAPSVDGNIPWGAAFEVWEKYGEIGESVGLEWGGRWKTRDCPHYERKETA